MPTWLGWPLTAAFLVLAGNAVARLGSAGTDQRARTAATADALMAVGMAVMCSPVGGPVPMAGWQTVFVLVTAWFAVRGDVEHAVAGLAMLYMLTAVPHSAAAMSAAWSPPMTGPVGLPLLGWAFVAYFGTMAVLTAVRGGSAGRRTAWHGGVMAVGTAGVLAVTLIPL